MNKIAFLLSLFFISIFSCEAVSASCPDPAITDPVAINEVNPDEDWIEFYIRPNETVNLNGFKLVLHGQGGINDTILINCIDCTYNGGVEGAYVVYGHMPIIGVPPAPPNFILDASIDTHQVWQEILLVDASDKLVHYLRYGNDVQTSKHFDYDDCKIEYSTYIETNGAKDNLCTNVDGYIGVENEDWINWSECDPTPGFSNRRRFSVDHYLIEHDGSGLTCAAETITVKACADETCSTTESTLVSGQLTSTGTQTDIALNFDTGSQSVTLTQTLATTISLGLTNLSPDSTFSCLNLTSGTTDCNMTFSDHGYILDVPDFIASEVINQSATIQAVQSTVDKTACVPEYVGQQNFSLDFSYLEPNSNHILTPLKVSYGANSLSIASGSPQNMVFDFNVPDAIVSFEVGYANAGRLNLQATAPSAYLTTDEFIARPAQLVITATDAGGLTLGVSGNESHIAGENFNLSLQGVNLEGNVTSNYRPGNLQLQTKMETPLIADGASAVSFNYGGSSAISITNVATWIATSGLTFDANGFVSNTAHIDDVGQFLIDVQDTDYFSYTITTASGLDIGRFTPAYFDIQEIVKAELANTHTNFSYIGEEVSFKATPTYQIVAKNLLDDITLNYDFTNIYASLNAITPTYVESNGVSFSFIDASLSPASDTLFDGVLNFSLGGKFTYDKEVTVQNEFDAEIDLTLASTVFTDSDGIGYDRDGASNGISYVNFVLDDGDTVNFDAIKGSSLRYGRLRLDNAFGPEDVPLYVNATLEYWDGTRFILNEDDSDTLLSLFSETIYLANDETNTPTSYTMEIAGTHFTFGGFTGTDGFFVNSNGNIVELRLEMTTMPDYLKFNWDGDEANGLENAMAFLIFGRYHGNDRIIFKRER